jgi:hypothetical protein
MFLRERRKQEAKEAHQELVQKEFGTKFSFAEHRHYRQGARAMRTTITRPTQEIYRTRSAGPHQTFDLPYQAPTAFA